MEKSPMELLHEYEQPVELDPNIPEVLREQARRMDQEVLDTARAVEQAKINHYQAVLNRLELSDLIYQVYREEHDESR